MNRQSHPMEVVESVYHLIKNQTGRIRLKDIIEAIGSKEKAHYAIIWLTRKRKIKRVKGFGDKGIEYFYHDLHQDRYGPKKGLIAE